MNIKEFTYQNIKEIANTRGWQCRREGCPNDCRFTCATYDPEPETDCRPSCTRSCLHRCEENDRVAFCPRMSEYVKYIGELFPYLNKDMTEVTFDDVKFALSKIRETYGYAESTMCGIRSCISVVYSFAEKHEGVYNIMKYMPAKKNERGVLSVLTSGRSKKAVVCELQALREKHRYLTKSLTAWQLEKLTQLLWSSIESDGRYCMIALMLYTGIRPAEGRALKWKDVVPFLDHPDRWILNLYQTRDRNGTLKQHMKTPNAYRRIPVHYELMVLLKKRRDYVLENSEYTDISDLPVCCLGNSFQTPCKDSDVCQLTDEVFASNLKMKQKDMYIYMLEAEIEKLSENPICAEKDQQLTLYVLRRAFWTWCEALTTLTDFEKRYIMGHDMKIDAHSVHSRYNDENLLWTICQKLDHCVIGKDLHKNRLLIEPKESSLFQVENRGLVLIHLTRDMLAKGGILQCYATSEEAGENLSLVSLSALRKYGKLITEAEVVPVPVKNELPVGINCEYENWMAHNNPTSPSLMKKKNKSGEERQETESCAGGATVIDFFSAKSENDDA